MGEAVQLKLPFPALTSIVNVASVAKLSPFRYPGGKTWLIPHVRRWLHSREPKPQTLVEPFAGGGIVGLTVAFENLAASVVMVELDPDIAAVWRTILNGKAEDLAQRILNFKLTTEAAKQVLSVRNRNLYDRAFATLVRNRVQHGGIMSPGASLMKDGENKKGIASRWYAATLARRIRDISEHRQFVQFKQGDGFQAIREWKSDETAVFFVDPPYTVAGRRLYRHSEIDHKGLFRLMSKVKGDFLITYDDTAEVRGWARKFDLDTETVAMKSRQHTKKCE